MKKEEKRLIEDFKREFNHISDVHWGASQKKHRSQKEQIISIAKNLEKGLCTEDKAKELLRNLLNIDAGTKEVEVYIEPQRENSYDFDSRVIKHFKDW